MHYRLYGLNAATGKIMQGRDLAAENDAEAIAAAEAVIPGKPFEIWCRTRLVFTRSRGMAEVVPGLVPGTSS